MREQTEQPKARPGRCANHPEVAEAGRCFVCARPLCLSCAIAFRGRVLGPECLATVLDDEPQMTFEAHSTDYQTRMALSALVMDGWRLV